jgi:Arc/MetJ family transcription regulator
MIGKTIANTHTMVYIYVYKEVCAMRTNIVLEDDLVREAFKHSRATTKKELIHCALKEYVENHGRRDLSDLKGKISFKDDYDYKKLRQGDPA